ncbi:MAG: hypothetical protein ACHQ4H_02920 [Ktedonobacterales bacterium]
MIALSNRVHIYARPESRGSLVWCFTTILGAEAVTSSDAPGLPAPVLAFSFPGGGSLSVEFTDEALDERQARWGAWLEIQSDDPATLRQKVIEAHLPQLQHPANDHFYFVAPGGQVLRIVAAGPR